MRKIQCTFRLPENVVDLIDKQDGETRTDKLLSLLGFGEKDVINGVRQVVISDNLEERLVGIEKRISELENAKRPSKPANSSYDDRRRSVLKKCRSAWLNLTPSERESITKKDFAMLSGVARATVTKYWDVFTKESID